MSLSDIGQALENCACQHFSDIMESQALSYIHIILNIQMQSQNDWPNYLKDGTYVFAEQVESGFGETMGVRRRTSSGNSQHLDRNKIK